MVATVKSPHTASPSKQHIVWCDLEFTTTDLERAAIMQAAVVVSTATLEPLPPPGTEGQIGLCFDVQISPEEASGASRWVQENQAQQLRRSLEHPDALPLAEVDRQLADYVRATCKVPQPGTSHPANPLMAGNSVHNDYHLVRNHMPELASLLSYRLLDVSTLKELVRRWAPKLEVDKASAGRHLPAGYHLQGQEHDALFDIQLSVAELSFYRQHLFKL